MAVKCIICGKTSQWECLSVHDKPDKYERWVGIEDVSRSWFKCDCGFVQQLRNYPLWQIERIYDDGYRDAEFRGESIEHAFERISNAKDSENEKRFFWFGLHRKYLDSCCVLDVGSGLGVWPALLKRAEYKVCCVEKNEVSKRFLHENLNLPCVDDLDETTGEYDVVSLIHVLEHIERPDSFLKKVKKRIRKGGAVFIELPDAIEFDHLPLDHDEFNSCHVAFYNIDSLYRLLDRNGFYVTDMHRVHYEGRNLYRIMCLATNK